MPFTEKKVEGELIVFKAWFKIAIQYTTLLLQACQTGTVNKYVFTQ
jgi:hypothetical protein